MAQKPSIPKGTRDFNPEQVAKRNYIFNTIRDVFETFGFQPIETPSFENSDTLMGKYGDEGDRLIFKILNSGKYFDEDVLEAFKNEESKLKNEMQAIYDASIENNILISELPLKIREIVAFFLSGSQNEEDRKVLRNQLNKILIFQLTNNLSSSLSSNISEKALRYDLTVPFARYV